VNAKVFAAAEPQDLEAALQAWLADNPGAGIVTAAQSADPSGRTILTVFYAEAHTQSAGATAPGGARRRA
jgi:hypothetical protein